MLAIADTKAAISRQADVAATQGADIGRLKARVKALEQGGSKQGSVVAAKRAVLSNDYLLARRSLRLWPIQGTSADDLWKGVEKFLEDSLASQQRTSTSTMLSPSEANGRRRPGRDP